MPTAEVVVPQVNFPEGPVWCGDGTLVFTSVPNGALYRLDVSSDTTGEMSTVAVVGGGANSAALASDGGFVVTQNGGIDFSNLPGVNDSLPPYAPITPGIQHVAADGTVRYLFDDGFLAPNDLTAAADGTFYFTDPPHHPPPPEPQGRVHAVGGDGTCRVIADGFVYCNGIALEPGGTLVVVEARGLLRLAPDGTREWIVERLGDNAGDGLALDVEGRIYACCTGDHAVRVFEPDGTEVDRYLLPGDGLVTNCCFGGDDLRTLFVTEGMPGRVLAFEGMPTPGLPLHRVAVP